ncbi:MAG: penicillin-binding protein, partial [Solirubrobacteraceae bacterium]|nr:penicillin-binding protein [Solirubrobacteraceae bacterium]
MNPPIVRLFGLVVLLFGVLIAFTSRWTVFEAQALRKNTANHRVLLAEERIKRGVIRAADGSLLAGSRPIDAERFARRYPTGDLFAHPVGYFSIDRGRTGLEEYYNDPLSGRATDAVGALTSLLGPQKVGDDLKTTLSPAGQKAAYAGLAGRNGAVVALDVHTGAVLALAATPSFDPAKPADASTFNRATQGRYPPGSTFKTVTAAAALDSGRYQPGSQVSGANHKVISGAPLDNFGGETFGNIDLTTALTHSVNTVWAEVGEKLGKQTMADYMRKFGFYADPPMDYPDRQMNPSGEYRNGRLLGPTSRFIDVGRMAIGQDKLLVTPLQMASVAQAIGNGGMRMEPRLVQKVLDPDGRTTDQPLPKEAGRVMSQGSADALTQMMKNVVREGTGTAAALQGVEVAGKTGTAEIDPAAGINDLWFIGFTPKVAVAVVIERQ